MRLLDKNIDIIAIHDGVRPLFSLSLLEKCIAHAAVNGSAVPAVRVHGTLILTEDGKKISGYIDRERARELQTPQVFKFELIYQAHLKASAMGLNDCTDDSRLFEMNGSPADIIDGEEHNLKITTQSDLFMAEELLKLRGADGKQSQGKGGR
jgi:2-C-methyl-D-erythritol 4-phosphate cytidylyltransferase / 2-C-methyl-D-erythritol 2,4-cyclodiphosphate synthase